MWIAIVAVAVAVVGVSVFAGRGRLGEMPAEAVNDRPKGHIPDGPVTLDLLDELRIPHAFTGYRAAQVDAYLGDLATGTTAPLEEQRFDVVKGGYDMQVVDELLARPAAEVEPSTPEDEAETPSESADEEPRLVTRSGTDLPDTE